MSSSYNALFRNDNDLYYFIAQNGQTGTFSSLEITGNLQVDGQITVDNGINFGQGNFLNFYQIQNATRSWINCSNVNQCDFRFVRIGNTITATMKPFNFGTTSGGGSLQTSLGSWIPSWAQPNTTTAIASFGVVNGTVLSSILFLLQSGGSGFTIHKWAGSGWTQFGAGDTLNITSDLILTYTIA